MPNETSSTKEPLPREERLRIEILPQKPYYRVGDSDI